MCLLVNASKCFTDTLFSEKLSTLSDYTTDVQIQCCLFSPVKYIYKCKFVYSFCTSQITKIQKENENLYLKLKIIGIVDERTALEIVQIDM